VFLVAPTDGGEEVSDVSFAGVLQPRYPLAGQLLGVTGQVAPVRRERVAGEAALDSEVVEVQLYGAQ